jgi:hypothetical protein
MDIGHDTMGTIIINSYAFGASVSAVSDVYSKDDAGNGAAGEGNSRVTTIIGGTATDDVFIDEIRVSAGDTVTVSFNGNWTGTETSIAWSVTEADNFANLVTPNGVSPTSGTSAGFDPVFTIDANGQTFDQATYDIDLAVTNSGGTTTVTFSAVLIIIP